LAAPSSRKAQKATTRAAAGGPWVGPAGRPPRPGRSGGDGEVGGGAVPTEAGRLLAEHAGAILDWLALAEEQLAELAGLRRGRVRLGSFFTAFALLTPTVATLAEARLPDLAVEHELVDRRTAFRQLTGPASVRHVRAALLRGQRAPAALALLEVLRELAPSG
jgi:DNA-binding transcriptional LysR family regulator